MASHIDLLAKRYLGMDVYPFRSEGQQRAMLKVQPGRIHTIGLDGDGWRPPQRTAH